MTRFSARRSRGAEFNHRLKFEELESRLLLSATGDAPNPPYPLAQHSGGVPSRLGPSALADDGVTFGIMRVGQVGATVTLDVQGTAAGHIDAWIDFNRDGSFGGPWEQIVNNATLSTAIHALTFDVPSWAEPGSTWARFRITTTGNVGVGGSATSGEVEDYAVTILPARPATGSFGTQNVIEDATGSAASVKPIFAADLDADGDNDVVSASSSDNMVAWHRNNGNGTFTRFNVGAANDPRSVFAADVDGDDDIDILATSLTDDSVYWYTNDGTPETGTWTRNTITSTADAARSVFAADVNRDGTTDVVVASFFSDKISWFQNNGSQVFTERVVNVPDSDADPNNGTNGDVNGPVALFAADIDRDGHLDIATSSSVDGKIVWFKNDGTPDTGTWGSPLIVKAASAIVADPKELWVVAADINGDGDVDLATANYFEDRIVWYENDGTPASGTWTQHTISTAADGAYSVFAADLDSDGDMDLLSASLNDDKIARYMNNGSGGFTISTITSSGNADGATSVFAADLDADGDLDAISGSRTDNKVAWYANPNVPGFLVTPTNNPIVVNETGTTDTFTVVLLSQPSSNVVFDVISSDTTESTVSVASLTFTAANWNAPQSVTVTGVNDVIVDGTQPSTITVSVRDANSDNAFDPLANQTVSVQTSDNDVAGFAVTPSGGTTQVSETGTTDTFTVVLTAQPLSPVVFDILASDTTEATASPTTLTFTTANWNVAQTVTVTGVNDVIVDSSQVSTITVRVNDASSDNAFDPLADQTVSVTTTDNDVAGFAVALSGGTTQVSETGTTDTFTVVLTAQPLSSVVLDILAGDTTEATASPTSLTFTTGNWSVAQTVTVTGVNDVIIDGTQVSTITVRVNDASSDNAFDPLADQTVSVSTTDNDAAGFTVTQSGGTTQVSENGTTDTFTVVLNVAPSSAVVFDILNSDTTEVTGSTASLTFTTGNWNVPQTVTVTGANDTIIDGNLTSTITVRVNDASSDNAFDPLPDQLVSVTTTDNDVSPIGDYDDNAIVNNSDYTVWRANFASTTQLAADDSGNNQVDAADFVLWRNNFGASGVHFTALTAGSGSEEPAADTVDSSDVSLDVAFADVATSETKIVGGLKLGAAADRIAVRGRASDLLLALAADIRDTLESAAIDAVFANCRSEIDGGEEGVSLQFARPSIKSFANIARGGWSASQLRPRE